MVIPSMEAVYNGINNGFNGLRAAVDGSYSSIVSGLQAMHGSVLGDGVSIDMGSGGGGYSGGGPFPIPVPDGGGGPSGGQSSNTVGGTTVIATCRRIIVITWSDTDDDAEPPHYSIEIFDSGASAAEDPAPNGMSADYYNTCFGYTTSLQHQFGCRDCPRRETGRP